MRAFVAIEIPEEIRNRIAGLIQALQPAAPKVRWARAGGMHITLKFLGEISEQQVEEIKTQLASVQSATPLHLQIQGAGYFPNERSPRVLWLGVQSGAALPELASQIEKRLATLGMAKEDRPFSAHLTLGRLQRPGKLDALREELRKREPLALGSFTTDEFFLYESKLSPRGSIHRRIARFQIGQSGC